MSSENLLVNSIYPVSYFSLPGVDEVQYPDKFWWSSKQRFARQFPGTDAFYVSEEAGGLPTQEILEIDLGRIRELNYVNFDVLRVPIDIKIEYDAISAPDRDATWIEVSHVEGLPFDKSVYFDPGNRSGWLNADFRFTTPRGQMVHTRYLRITFTRRDDKWPTTTSQPFRWPVFVKHLRLGRAISTYLDSVGPLLAQEPEDTQQYILPDETDTTTREVRQRFRAPAAAERAGAWPNLLGFGVLADVKALADGGDTNDFTEVALAWSLWNVSDPGAPELLRTGKVLQDYNPGLTWINWYMEADDALPLHPRVVYELRLLSENNATLDSVYLAPRPLSSTALPGTFAFTENDATVTATDEMWAHFIPGDWLQTPSSASALQVGSITTATEFELAAPFPSPSDAAASASRVYPLLTWSGGAYEENANLNLVMRVWADVGDEGRDILGNTYRYGVRREAARNVVDGTKAGWMSDPVPSKDAVEALYFDLRNWDKDEAAYKLRLVDAIRVAPRTPGVSMNIYYSKENLQGDTPANRDAWDNLLWTPAVQGSFTLRENQVIELPKPMQAAFVKLEFTNLNPVPWRVPSYPPLPPKTFRRFPSWVEDQFTNSQLRNVVEDWWLREASAVQVEALRNVVDPVREFEYKEREFFAALSLGEVEQRNVINANLVDANERSVVDPVTGSKIWLEGPDKFKNTLLLSVERDSALGRAVVARYDPYAGLTPIEREGSAIPSEAIPSVSSVTNRVQESYSHIANIPMRFNRTARHYYREDTAEFNRKAFFVGIDEVQFLRNRHHIKHNDEAIVDVLYDDELLELNTWEREAATQIDDGQTVYVSYHNQEEYVDEAVTLTGSTPVKLQGQGGEISYVYVYASPSKRGQQYWQNDDWNMDHKRDENGELTHWISRSVYTARLGVPEQPVTYADAGLVIGRAFIPSTPTYDEGTVTAVAVVTGDEGPYVPAFGTGTYGGEDGTYANLASDYADSAQADGVAVPSGAENIRSDDSGTATAVAVITGDEIFEDV